MPKLIIFNKPYQVLSQFTDDQGRSTLADFIKIKDIYPAGRLDYDSEGLLLLTENGTLQSLISHPRHKLAKTYWVQVEGEASEDQCRNLCTGVKLKDGKAQASQCKLIDEPNIWRRDPPIRVRKTVPDSWIELTIHEGRNRQVRRMTAAVGLPTLRLVRASIGNLHLHNLPPGQHRIHSNNSVKNLFNQLLETGTTDAR